MDVVRDATPRHGTLGGRTASGGARGVTATHVPRRERTASRAARRTLALLALLAMASGCAAPGPFVPATLSAVTDDLDAASLAVAIDRSLVALHRDVAAARDEQWKIGRRRLHARDIAAGLERARDLLRDGEPAALATACRVYGARDTAKVTAYYEPLLPARLAPDAHFRFPLYAHSSKALTDAETRLARVPTREDIDGAGVLDGRGLEIAWLGDAVERFFLHVQGSGRLDLGDGATARVAFAGTNGLDYRSVGARMLADGLLEPGQATAPAMKKTLRAMDAKQRDALLFHNPRYVFFRLVEAAPQHDAMEASAESARPGATPPTDEEFDGPAGALGVPLVSGRSVAADLDLVPRGALGFLRTTQPLVDDAGRATGGRRALTRFVVVHDTGAAIRGPARLDLFMGSGERAGLEAGAMNEAGEFFVLLCEP